jgi:dienelactone hydrolase
MMEELDSFTTDQWLAKADLAANFASPGSKAEWQLKRKTIRAALWQLLGKLPRRPEVPCVETLSREERGGFILEKFAFDNQAGDKVPGYLLLPTNMASKAPGVLFCHWHGGEYDIGKEELFESRHTPEAPGPALARKGIVVMGVDACCFGERNGKGPGGPDERNDAGEMTASKFNLWVGRTLWGMILRDDLMALDYLASRPEVDPEWLGVTGISMGATRTWWLMGLDDRLKSGVAVACLTRYQNLIRNRELRAHGIYYFVPNLLNHFDTEAIVALIAPRTVLFQTGDKDAGSPIDGVRAIESAVRPVYGLYRKEPNFRSIIYPGVGHEYTQEMWNQTVRWLAKTLGAHAV